MAKTPLLFRETALGPVPQLGQTLWTPPPLLPPCRAWRAGISLGLHRGGSKVSDSVSFTLELLTELIK